MLKIDFHRDEQKAGGQCILQISKDACTQTHTHFDIQYLQIEKGRDKMLLIKVNMIKSLFRFLETNEEVSKHHH